MKYTCIRKCQVRHEDRVLLAYPGRVLSFDEDPGENWQAIGVAAYIVDFTKASEEELTEAKWKFQDAFDAVKGAFGVILKREDGTKKSEVIAQILDARYRSISPALQSELKSKQS